MTDDLPDHYAALGVARTASPREITQAYHRLVRRHHPDSQPATHEPAGPIDDDRLLRVIAAYAVLRNPDRRADYDRQLGPVRATRPGRAYEGLARPHLRIGPVRYHGPPRNNRGAG